MADHDGTAPISKATSEAGKTVDTLYIRCQTDSRSGYNLLHNLKFECWSGCIVGNDMSRLGEAAYVVTRVTPEILSLTRECCE
jgi:hypothetical protein